MKNLILVIGMICMMNVYAADYQHPSATEIAATQACFTHLEDKGCGKLE